MLYTLVPVAFYNAKVVLQRIWQCVVESGQFLFESAWMQGFSFGYQTELHSKDALRIKLDKCANRDYCHGLSPPQLLKSSHVKIIFPPSKKIKATQGCAYLTSRKRQVCMKHGSMNLNSVVSGGGERAFLGVANPDVQVDF